MRNNQKKPSPTDVYIGHMMREQRLLHGLSQEHLAQKLGITFQQVQKYENAQNRLSASRLADVSRIFKMTPNDFFPHHQHPQAPHRLTRQEAEVLRIFRSLNEETIKLKFFALLQALGNVSPQATKPT